ncbi:MAG: DUF2807 domain-containing protein [Bacteroidales bacterium]|nr:DUF2807 domain-containing protein [Bacteroidales bacterium]
MKKFIFISFAMVMMACTISATKQSTTTRTFNVDGNFNAIDVAGAYEVTCCQDASKAGTIEMEGPENILANTKVTLKGQTLDISTKGYGSKNNNGTTKVILYYTNEISDIELSGACILNISNMGNATDKAEIEVTGASRIVIGQVCGTKADIEASGASNVEIASCEARTIEADASGASHISINGIACTIFDGDASGASKIAAQGKAVNVKAEASGASNLDLGDLECETVKADIPMTCHLTYYGKATLFNSSNNITPKY